MFLVFGFFAFILPNQSSAQLNIKIGYSLNYSPSLVNNDILSSYDNERPWLNKTMGELHFLNGLQAGLRYRIEMLAFDLSWERVSKEKTANGINPVGQTHYTELKYNFNRYSAGIELGKGVFAFGTNVYMEDFKIKSPLSGIEGDENVIKDYNFGNKVYLNFATNTHKLHSISLQPFVLIPWSPVNLFNLENHLNTEAGLRTYNQWNFHYGISIVFYNGPQS